MFIVWIVVEHIIIHQVTMVDIMILDTTTSINLIFIRLNMQMVVPIIMKR